MLTLPKVIERPAQAYAYVTYTVRMDQMQKPADEGFPRLFGALASQSISPVGAPLYNYRRIDMANTLDVEAGVPVAKAGQDSDGIAFGTLPAGRYVTLDWHGHPDKLMDVTAMLIGWLKEVGRELDVRTDATGDHFACRLEIYETDPDDEPDMDKWVTTLAFKLRD